MTTEEQLRLPRGVRVFTEKNRRHSFACQWRVDGKRKTKFFEKMGARDKWALGLAGDTKEMGAAAGRLDASEARKWRAFRLEIGDDAPLDAVVACWLKHGKARAPLTVREAVAQFLKAKEAEGLAKATLDHCVPVYERLCARIGNHDVSAVSREDVAAFVEGTSGSDYSRRTHQIRVRTLFNWLRANRLVADNPCDGMKAVKIVADDVQTWTVDEVAQLFAANESEPPELLGRLACECFAGLRFSSAALLNGNEDFHDDGISLPARKIKTRRRQFIDGLPDNLGFWVRRSNPAEWSMTPKQYMQAKTNAVLRAGIRRIHNAARHGFGTYHMALYKDASKTAAMLCHTSPKMLYSHYKGRATEAQGVAYFLIYPTGASCPIDQKRPAPGA